MNLKSGIGKLIFAWNSENIPEISMDNMLKKQREEYRVEFMHQLIPVLTPLWPLPESSIKHGHPYAS
ncbi:MAG: hypothetical protein D3925_10775 [Candidatus Electrothrix sp. AR5]|nr:hypothetical protein [Candidatus Electrothrix sp. AR5]